MNKLPRKIIGFLFFIFYLSAFASDQKQLVVVLDWFVNPNHAPLFVAEQEGFFASQGIKVKFISPADATYGEKMVAANQADIAVTYQPALMHHVTQGLPLVRFATLINVPLNCFIVLKNGKISSIKDLKGKRIGYSAQAVDSIMFSTMLKAANLQTSDAELINVKFNLTQALLTGKIDGFTGGMRNFEPIAIELAGKLPKVFYPEECGFPKYDELILVAHKNKVHDPSLIKFTYALRQAVAYLKKNPHKSWEKFSANHPELNNVLNKKVWFETLPYFADDPAKLDRERYQKFTKFMWERGMIKYMPKIKDYTGDSGSRRL